MTDKSDRIKELLNNPYLKDAFSSVKAHYIEQLEKAPVDSEPQTITLLLDLKRMIALVDDVEADLRQSIQQGELEDYRANEPNFLGELNGKH